ncbi:uncharacterized protein EI90DRAFT_3052517 [Cantharellus anzutake]|uniref:uncharacterized protein n=1 Tax=Cantharellus anzutake TaxID=1750568 RepID=UPI001908CC54|nr:uncharacterized protein EI90DRAFT_3052517 [Cantharellus anzutake]KAF8333597.1 hypothetical protein EI90DRAFT_3052517 [Cantharellus anzutake]
MPWFPSVWGFPISLFWFAWTSAPGLGHTSYWNPVMALLGIVDPFLWLGMLNYIAGRFWPVHLFGALTHS